MNTKILYACVFAIGWLGASPFVSAYQIKTALNEEDAEALSDKIDFPVLRQNVKEQLKVAMAEELAPEIEENPFAALGAVFGAVMLDGVVDTLVTPAGIAALMRGEDPLGESGIDSGQSDSTSTSERNPFEDVSMRFKAWDKFHIKARGKDDSIATIVLRRDGLSWKMTNIILPTDN